MCADGKVRIYRVLDLDTWDVYYVGRTSRSIADRMDEQLSTFATTGLKELFRAGRRLGWEEYQVVEPEDGKAAELVAIHEAQAAGHRLLNVLGTSRGGWQELSL